MLLIRFWHPDLSTEEIEAFKLIFEYLDHAAMGDDQLEMFEMKKLLGKDNHAGLQVDHSNVDKKKVKKYKSEDRKMLGKKKEKGNKEKDKSSAPSSSRGFGKK